VVQFQVVYIKATEGGTYTDPIVRTYYRQAKANGLKVAFYHYLRNNNPIDEVNNLLQATAGLVLDCKYAIDCEVTLGQSKQQITNNVRRFFDIMKSKGLECVLYTYSSFLNGNLDYSQLSDIPVWIANYSDNDPHVANEVGWQYSEYGRISGNSHDTDLNIFYDKIFIGKNGNASDSIPINVQPIVVNSGDATVRTIQIQLNQMLKCNLDVDGWEIKLINKLLIFKDYVG
jgi:GH25 family lysozyme M1 (1,4-beta-N-acetylmuramidase)